MIDWVRFERLLRGLLRHASIRVGAGTVRTAGDCPLRVHQLLRACSDEPEEQEELRYADTWPAVPLEFLEQRYERVRWFDFYWDSIGPTSWICNLYLLRRSQRSSLVCLLQEEEPLFLLGLIEPHDDPLLLSQLFTRLVDRNGERFGVSVFGSLPTETTNWLPHLVDEWVVKQAYWDWLEWAEPALFDSWLDLEQSLAVYDLEPNPMKRSLAALSGLPDLTEPTAVADWLDEHDQESAGLPDHSKQAILDWYFRRRYVTDSVR